VSCVSFPRMGVGVLFGSLVGLLMIPARTVVRSCLVVTRFGVSGRVITGLCMKSTTGS